MADKSVIASDSTRLWVISAPRRECKRAESVRVASPFAASPGGSII